MVGEVDPKRAPRQTLSQLQTIPAETHMVVSHDQSRHQKIDGFVRQPRDLGIVRLRRYGIAALLVSGAVASLLFLAMFLRKISGLVTASGTTMLVMAPSRAVGRAHIAVRA